jgi:hypothetical protein
MSVCISNNLEAKIPLAVSKVTDSPVTSDVECMWRMSSNALLLGELERWLPRL